MEKTNLCTSDWLSCNAAAYYQKVPDSSSCSAMDLFLEENCSTLPKFWFFYLFIYLFIFFGFSVLYQCSVLKEIQLYINPYFDFWVTRYLYFNFTSIRDNFSYYLSWKRGKMNFLVFCLQYRPLDAVYNGSGWPSSCVHVVVHRALLLPNISISFIKKS